MIIHFLGYYTCAYAQCHELLEELQ